MIEEFNNRILLIDDNEAIHNDFKKALTENPELDYVEIQNLEKALTGKTDKKTDNLSFPKYEIHSAYQGKEALEIVVDALNKGLPYALAFVDIRMPPGWDGIETIEKIWGVDKNIQTVICTAHSDYSWEEIYRRLGHSDRLLILKKPFDLIEIRLLALNLTKKWILNAQAKLKEEDLQEMVTQKTKELSFSLSLTEATLESTADGIIVIDKKNKIVNFNRKFLEIWDISEEQLEQDDALKLSNFMSKKLEMPKSISLDSHKMIEEKNFDIYQDLKLKTNKFIEQYIKLQYHNQKIVGIVYNFRDITHRKRLEEELAKQATYDNLTGLPNRILLADRIQHAILLAKRNKTYLAILFIDLNSFKLINDSFGHHIGDELLKIFSHRLKNSLRESDTVGRMNNNVVTDTVSRLGGDEFVVVLTTPNKDKDSILPAIQRLNEELIQPYHLASHELTVTLSMGISFFPEDGFDPITLIKNADSAMYRAKELKQTFFEFYQKEMSEKTLARLELENDLRQALVKKELFLNYQPLFDLNKKRIASLEVLMRWAHPTLGLIPPTTFIPLAESSNMIGPISDWLLRTACSQNKAWQDQGLPPIPISVNVSVTQFKYKNFVENLEQILTESGLEPKYLELEFTENIIMSDNMDTTLKMEKLKKLGVAIDIDDFGTGYSSLNYINQFPIDKIKIDRSFINSLSNNEESKTIVQAIMMIAKSLNMCVVAEGVETISQLNILRAISMDEVQGFYLSLPLSVEDTTKILNKNWEWPISS